MESQRALEILQGLKPVVIEAGDRYIRPRYFDHSYEIRFVDDKSAAALITENGMNVSRHIMPYCREILPGSYSEEEQEGRRYRGPLFVVDPDDDTLGFRHGLYETTGTLVGLLDEENRAVGGLAYAPETRIFSLSVVEYPLMTAYYNEMKIDGKKPVPVKEPAEYIMAVQRMDAPNPQLDEFLKSLGMDSHIRVETIEGPGPGAFAAVSGRYDYNLFAGTVSGGNWKEWDAAGLEPILMAIGWDVTDLRGNMLTYNNFDPKLYQGLLATRLSHLGLWHEYVTEHLAGFSEKYGPIFVTPDVYKRFEASERLAVWAEAIKTVPSPERHKYLKRQVLVE